LAENIGSAVRVVLSLTGIIFTGLMVYAGFLWMTAKGDESKVEKAQEIIKAAIIGWVVTVGAYSITDFVVPAILSRLGGN
jgi:TRAP-type C4-dicarboxylate transport system permease small subunit